MRLMCGQMYEKALEKDQYHVLTLCCYADMLSDRFNPLRDDARADAMLALARSKVVERRPQHARSEAAGLQGADDECSRNRVKSRALHSDAPALSTMHKRTDKRERKYCSL